MSPTLPDRFVREQSDHRSSLFQPARRFVFAQDDGRQMAAVAVGQLALVAVVNAQKERGVLFRRSALVELMVEQRKHGAG